MFSEGEEERLRIVGRMDGEMGVDVGRQETAGMEEKKERREGIRNGCSGRQYKR